MENAKKYQEEINHNDIGNNLGDLFNVAKKETKMGTKVTDKQDEIKELTTMVKEMDINDSFAINQPKLKSILEFLYTGNDLGRHLKYMDQRHTSQGCLEYAYNLIMMREDSLRKFESRFAEDYE